MNDRIVPRTFYNRDTHDVAKEILGKILVRRLGKTRISARINDVECYIGEDDKACHASKGKTNRTEVMYGEAGYAYIYLIYGMYHCLNIVTERKGFPAAILIRGVLPIHSITSDTNGPGKLCRAMAIDRSLNGHDMTQSSALYIADDGFRVPKNAISTSPRIGVSYAGDDAMLPWRYYIEIAKNSIAFEPR